MNPSGFILSAVVLTLCIVLILHVYKSAIDSQIQLEALRVFTNPYYEDELVPFVYEIAP